MRSKRGYEMNMKQLLAKATTAVVLGFSVLGLGAGVASAAPQSLTNVPTPVQSTAQWAQWHGHGHWCWWWWRCG